MFLCTDGLANVGLGSLEDSERECALFYTELAEQAKLRGVTVTVISLIGTECALESLSIVCEQTAGSVQRVDPVQLTGNLVAFADRPVVAYGVMAMVLLHHGLQFRGEMDDEGENRNWVVKDLGNVTRGKELTFSYAFRPKDQCDLSGIEQIPFQVQVLFTRPNGMRCLRVATARVAVTDDRAQAEQHADIGVIGTHAAQRAAKFAKAGDYEKAQLETRAAQRFIMRNADVDRVSLFSNHVEQIDQVLRAERQREKHEDSSVPPSTFATTTTTAAAPSSSITEVASKKKRTKRSDAAATAISSALTHKFD